MLLIMKFKWVIMAEVKKFEFKELLLLDTHNNRDIYEYYLI